MRKLPELAKHLRDIGHIPNALAKLDQEIAEKSAYLNEKMKSVKLERAVFWNMKFAGEKTLSDTYIETKWQQTETGKEEIKLKYELDGLKGLTSAIKNSIVVASLEAKNNA